MYGSRNRYKLGRAIPVAYQHRQPEREHELNSLINSLVMNDRDEYEREYPAVRFSFAVTVPDHSITNTDYDLFIEAKYLRKKMSPSGITDELAADLTKYPEKAYKLFIIYDPERRIPDDVVFKRGFNKHTSCLISIVR